ncbi:MAG: polysulfide reductase NrfD [Deltaproteobacteria bacterium]|nr:polysulfide reductase NrfD [Deltaproteobacteria bacterium]
MEQTVRENGGEKLTPYRENIPDTFEIRFAAQSEWKFWEVLAFYVGGVGAGLYAISHFMRVPAGLIAGFFMVVVLKNGAHLLSSSHPGRALKAFSNPKNSWVSRGAYFILFFTIFGAADILLRLGWFPGFGLIVCRSISFMAVLFAFLIMIYVGFVMTTSRSIPLWNSSILPAIFLSYSVALGGACGFIVYPAVEIGYDVSLLSRMLIISITATLFCIVIHLLVLKSSSHTARASVDLLLKGSLRVLFLGGVVTFGLVIPLGLLSHGALDGHYEKITGMVSGVMVLIGGFLYETVLCQGGLYSPLLDVEQPE